MKSCSRIKDKDKELVVNIDFDEASTAWKANKKYKGNGTYRYICSGFFTTGNKCMREPLQGCEFCKIHQKK
jgi:hypothetical protein